MARIGRDDGHQELRGSRARGVVSNGSSGWGLAWGAGGNPGPAPSGSGADLACAGALKASVGSAGLFG